ncbi:hypothetical protein [Methylosinus sp. KRF6]|uniref:hypothetical protein n=1 Tax=Methylosinus sp. KRF6 TaxID=2846853 RepID=UPI001C0E8624|nr:hypothetical protein [Methylosinus sp. KRF6]MBU3887119.1 hypothetical protein [Methylosinus sp. KRF6]
MSTIAKDYAAELRRISSIIKYGLSAADVSELRLAAQYLEERENGVWHDPEVLERLLSPAVNALVESHTEEVDERLADLLSGFMAMRGENSCAFLSLLACAYLDFAAALATSPARLGGPMTLPDFLETARVAWGASLLQDAMDQSQKDRARAS